jgi:uncharacterized membrane protein YphA (DoxX/SURF4 family)
VPATLPWRAVTSFGYACALALAGVFVWAAAMKLAHPARTAASMRALGVPVPRVLAWAVPLAELALAVALGTAPSEGGVVAVGVLSLFSALLARAVRRGVEAPCGCLGTTGSEPVSAADLVRNLLLSGLALGALLAVRPVVPHLLAIAAVLALLVGGRVTLARARRAGARR